MPPRLCPWLHLRYVRLSLPRLASPAILIIFCACSSSMYPSVLNFPFCLHIWSCPCLLLTPSIFNNFSIHSLLWSLTQLQAIILLLFSSDPISQNTFFTLTDLNWDWRDSLVKTWAWKCEKPSLIPRICVERNWVWWPTLAIPEQESQRQGDPWNLLASHLFGDL